MVILSIGLLDTAAFLANLPGFTTGQIAIVSILVSLYRAVIVALAWLFLKERLAWSQWIGIGFILGGVVCQSLSIDVSLFLLQSYFAAIFYYYLSHYTLCCKINRLLAYPYGIVYLSLKNS